eukprot:TRINITY_DN6179_c0_g2_i1.p3 TRINITY_DN6179_c0_g2~~TRINITY_DN6179_c0_g2_i1.p3  ORF type:complete len:110 (-),score=5.95 TRINITY_DN6179_c0_g2_i1:141-470(-)
MLETPLRRAAVKVCGDVNKRISIQIKAASVKHKDKSISLLPSWLLPPIPRGVTGCLLNRREADRLHVIRALYFLRRLRDAYILLLLVAFRKSKYADASMDIKALMKPMA